VIVIRPSRSSHFLSSNFRSPPIDERLVLHHAFGLFDRWRRKDRQAVANEDCTVITTRYRCRDAVGQPITEQISSASAPIA
jgi:hypothetical protein